jgi:hypothetical protein
MSLANSAGDGVLVAPVSDGLPLEETKRRNSQFPDSQGKSNRFEIQLLKIKERLSANPPIPILMDWQRHSLRIDGREFGDRINSSSWAFLAALAEIQKNAEILAQSDQDFFPHEQLVENKIKPKNVRRELGRQIGSELVSLVVKGVRGRGYRLSPRVHIVRRGRSFAHPADPWSFQNLSRKQDGDSHPEE